MPAPPSLNSSNSFTKEYVASLIFTSATAPLLSIRLVVFTISPRMSYWKFTPQMYPLHYWIAK